MSYTQDTLPLSPLKVVKKTIVESYKLLVISGISLVIGYSLPQDAGDTRLFLMGGGLLVGLMACAAVMIYEYLYYRFYYYSFGEQEAVIRKGVVSRSTGHVNYERLQNIYIDQDVFDRIFGLYDVHYETAGEQSGFYSHVDGLNHDHAETLVNFLNEHMRGNIKTPNAVAANMNIRADNTPIKTANALTRNECPISPLVIVSMIIGSLIAAALITAFIAPFLYFLNGENIRIISSGSFGTLGLVIFVVFVIILLLSGLSTMIWFKNFYFEFGPEKGLIRTQVLSQSTSYLYYDRIQNITLSQGFIDRLLGLHNLTIETAGEASGTSLKIFGLTQGAVEKLRDFLTEKAKIFKRNL